MSGHSGRRTLVLEAIGISKSFPGVLALDDVSFDVAQGEVHALCGENGAGKSTLMRILAGSFRPSTGHIRYNGAPVELNSPLDARQRGILLVHQELSLVRELTVAENIFLGRLPVNRWGQVDRKLLIDRTTKVLKSLGGDFDHIKATELVGTLSIARQQMVEVARAAALKPSVVIFDEPTASLTANEATALFGTIVRMRDEGMAIVYISHKMSEIFEVSNRITVLRDGRIRGTLETKNTGHHEVTRLMVGRVLAAGFPRAVSPNGPEQLRVENFCVKGWVKDVSLEVRQGEVLGLYGLIGAGRSELVEAICALRPNAGGEIHVAGNRVDICTPKQAMAHGIALVPEDRKLQGLVLGMSCRENVSLAIVGALARLGWNNKASENAIYEEYRNLLGIKASSPNTIVGTLSGGNQQKIVLAKWLASKPTVLILDEPTRGIDVGAKGEIYSLIAKLTESGLAVLLISSELPEIIGLSHRILAMHDGSIVGEFAGENATEENILSTMLKLRNAS
ncbi:MULTISPECIES: sugar ABC transporter ATP-binding protein [unclassified Mesorhizobium]|uniref:sugar ABC transporter ATP-binding protein n=1 Tax=unclassified Mesorhizobium TaxID=325217 RepID=UPI000FDBF983|nr:MULTISPECIES: sugar ABC transporter ATP-binding protein [unclassified Mesorhizobium]TGR23022.1 sugar ABC transporter ATP-binding protein [Mesorhizobium sp. M8A.F.Ca.ET.197.01.1.1]TGR39108.1 sugar ABC transporter ATP-binding protein [bacterium M00.F.Ca.ET.199.01.1.1]TGR46701.1 sugar ABC transporter ATP-binding protein [Mesorhizobium sp. M8A.F.Ca.ET.198.01.1.1]TGV85225.1 sugar ABC transporter ATP-binding protein [Mesorhizobium sp. M00.F.Ca.ET.149.01.1.1]